MADSSFFTDGGSGSGTFQTIETKIAEAEAAKVAAEAAQAGAEQAETDAETAEAGSVAAKNTAVASSSNAAISESNAASSSTNASNKASDAQKLAINPEDSQYTLSDGSTTGYSALHYNEKAADSLASATTQASNAAASAVTAGQHKDDAQSAKTAAESARDSALSALDNFEDNYLGDHSSDPTTDGDGDPLTAGSIYFNTTDSVVKVYTGSAWVVAYADGATLVAKAGDTMTGDLSFGDNDKAIFGAGDLEIYHNGTDSFIDEKASGWLYIRANDMVLGKYTGETYVKGIADGAVELYHDNSKKIETTATGASVTGGLTVNLGTDAFGKFANNISEVGSGNLAFQVANTAESALKPFGIRAEDVRIATGSNERLRVDSAGNLLISTTSNAPRNFTGGAGGVKLGSDQPEFAVGTMFINRSSTSDGDAIILRKEGSTFGSIGVKDTDLYIGKFAVGLSFDSTGPDGIRPFDINSQAYRDNAIDLGGESARFNDLYLGGTAYVGTSVGIGDTAPVTPLTIATTNKLGSTFTGTTNGEGLTVTQTNYTAGNYISLVEAAYDDSGDAAPNVRIGAMFDGNGSNLAFGTSNSYGSGITNTAMFINSSGNVLAGKTSASRTTVGHELQTGGFARHTADGDKSLEIVRKSSDGEMVEFFKDSTLVGSIGVASEYLYIHGTRSTDAGLMLGSQTVAPASSTGANRDNSIDLGFAGNSFKDLYLGGFALIGSDSGDGFNADATLRLQKASGNNYVQIKTASSGQGGILIGDTDDDFVGGMIYNNSSNYLRFDSNNAEKMRLEGDGDLHVDGNVVAYSTTISDIRLKKDIAPIEDAVTKVQQLNGCTFTYLKDDRKSAGLIAQHVEKVLPSAVIEDEAVFHGEEGQTYKTVQYDQVIGLLVEAVKELKQEIEELKKG
jgi:hypothetical protein